MLHIAYAGRTVTRPLLRWGRRAELYRVGRLYAAGVEAALDGAGLSVETTSAAGIPGRIGCRVLAVDLADLTVSVALRAGLLVADVAAAADRIAEALHADRVDVDRVRPGIARLTVHPLRLDPWANPIPRPLPLVTVTDPLLLGRLDTGDVLRHPLTAGQHAVVQGATQSGKTTLAYAVLGQLAHAPDVHVTGCDPSGILLRPWTRRPDHAGWQTLGTGDPAAHVDLLARLVKRMDHRLSSLPDAAERVTLGPDCPLTLVVLEEFPGLLRLLERTDRKLRTDAQGLYARLLAEGAKAGIRVWTITQRADADIIGGYERGQATLRLSFPVDNPDAVRMLHPAATRDQADRHTLAPAGEALVTTRGLPLSRMRAPHVDGPTYWATVTDSAPAAA